MSSRPPNHARFVFLDPRAEGFYPDWERAALETAAILRSAAGRDPHDRDLSDLVGELATQSEAFTYAAEPGSRSEEALNLLGRWAATLDPAESARPTSRS